MKIWQILVPVSDNEGNIFSVAHHRAWDAVVRRLARGGLTIQQPAKGEWTMQDGKIIREEMIPVSVIANFDQMVSIVEFTAQHYRQKAVFYYVISEQVYIYGDNKIKAFYGPS